MINRFDIWDREYVLFTDHEKDKAEAVLAERKRVIDRVKHLYKTNHFEDVISKIEEEVK